MTKTKFISFCILILLSGCQYGQLAAPAPYAFVYSSNEDNGREIYLSDNQGGARIKVTSFTKDDGYPAISPDGKHMAFYGKYENRKTWSIHTVNIDGSNMRRLTNKKQVWDSAPDWSPDGKTIVFAREYQDTQKGWQEEIWLMNADGSEQRQIKSLEGRAPYFMPDGRILFHSKMGPSQICIANIDGSGFIQLTHNDANDWSPKLSPNGKKIAFISNRDGNQEVYVMNIDGSNQQRLTYSDAKDWGPAWSADGETLFFNARGNKDTTGVYKMNKDGSSIEKILNNGSQVATVKSLNKLMLKNLIHQHNTLQQ